jgi:hypothetical protein
MLEVSLFYDSGTPDVKFIKRLNYSDFLLLNYVIIFYFFSPLLV